MGIDGKESQVSSLSLALHGRFGSDLFQAQLAKHLPSDMPSDDLIPAHGNH